MRKTTAQKGNPELIQALTEIEKEKEKNYYNKKTKKK